MARFTKGQKVWVVEPYEDFDGDAFFPGEDLYVVTPPGITHLNGKTLASTTCRVRCPASGADAWVEESLLVAVPSTGWPRALQKSRAENDDLSQKITGLQSDHDALHRLVKNVINGHVGENYLRDQYTKMFPDPTRTI